MTRSTLLPQRCNDLTEALERLRRDGAVILTGLDGGPDAARQAAGALFEGRALAIPEAAEVRAGGVRDLAARRLGPEDGLDGHTDGFAYGDHYPDFLFLQCDHASPEGGESFLVDGYGVLADLADEPGGEDLVAALGTVAVDQTEEGMHRSLSPVVGRGVDGRRALRRFPFQRAAADSARPEADTGMLEAWAEACRQASAAAPRFKLEAGEALVADNYRVLHGREPYTDRDRLLWRVWVWTERSNGVPDGLLHSDTRFAAASAGTALTGVTAESASVLPVRVSSPEEAAARIAKDGAAVMSGLHDLDAAVAFARAVLGERLVRLAPQFEATATGFLANQAKVAALGPDPRGRVRRFTAPDEVMVAHNDGYGFGDLSPDFLFLWCERPDVDGGASWLVDGAGLLAALAFDPAGADLERFCWEVDIDHSEPNFIVQPPAPIARRLPTGRVQVRHNPYQAAVLGHPDEPSHELAVEAWHDAVAVARSRAHRFTLCAGDLLCADNYRVLHGRDAYHDPERKVVSIWGWSDEAVAVPSQTVSIV